MRYEGKQRLVVAAGEQLDLPALDHVGQQHEHLGVVALKPLEEDARVVQHHGEIREPVQNREKGLVRPLVHPLEDVVEVSDGEGVMGPEYEPDSLHYPVSGYTFPSFGMMHLGGHASAPAFRSPDAL